MGLASPCPRGWERKMGHTRASNKEETAIQKVENTVVEMNRPLSSIGLRSHPALKKGVVREAGNRQTDTIWHSRVTARQVGCRIVGGLVPKASAPLGSCVPWPPVCAATCRATSSLAKGDRPGARVFALTPRSVFVVGVVAEVAGTKTLSLLHEGSLLFIAQQLPLSAQALGDLRVVHLGVLLRHLAALNRAPHHEGVHGPLHLLQRKSSRRSRAPADLLLLRS